METKLKRLLRPSPFEAIKKILVNHPMEAVKLFVGRSSIATSFGRPNQTSKMSGSHLFRHVRVNYSYLRRMQPNLYGRRRRRSEE